MRCLALAYVLRIGYHIFVGAVQSEAATQKAEGNAYLVFSQNEFFKKWAELLHLVAIKTPRHPYYRMTAKKKEPPPRRT